MHWCAVVCFVVWCEGACAGLQCSLTHTSALKFSITSLRNETGHWIAQLQMGHDAGEKSAGPYEVDVDHSTAKCENSESILISAKITAPTINVITKPTSRGIPTAPGYELVPSLGYYKLHTVGNTWHGALKICEEEGAHLLIVNSDEEALALKPLWDKNPPANISGSVHNNWAWIGVHDMYKEGEYLTIFNETLQSPGYVKWGSGQGRDGTSQNCVMLDRDLKLADYECHNKEPFFCEKEI
ncbi:hemolymph lipopolysaccharide-binding protein-like [Periplaneta americana]|uniref:hemolymph lipopolysaccharide-binding protein-like n=1 Tax=Periplaneta americana TaxID=6978 RepID=UPI0037E8C0F0